MGKWNLKFKAVFYSILLTVLVSCIAQDAGSGKRVSKRSATATTETTPSDPIFTDSLNFFQDGSSTFTSTYTTSFQNQSGFKIRGNEVDTYIKNGRTSEVHCLVSRFPSSLDNKLLVVAAKPQFEFNFNTNSQEYFYSITPSDEATNKAFCNKATLITNLNLSLGIASTDFAFSTTALCPSCTTSQLISDKLLFTNSSGQGVSEIVTTYLSLKLFSSGGSVGSQSCTSSSSCKAQGFDCCSTGQCVNDKQIKDGVDQTSSDFLQSLQDILQNPANIFNYTNFYHICSIDIVPIPTPTPGATPEDLAAERLEELQELFNCVNPTDGEMSICTFTQEDATGTGTYSPLGDDRSFIGTHTNSNTLNALPSDTITKVVYAGETLYDARALQIAGSMTLGAGNDNFDDAQTVTLSTTPSTSAKNNDLKINYQTDGSCEKISNSLAKCYKVYVQGQDKSEIDDHFPASNDFNLPFYADTDKTIKVEVDNTSKIIGTHWNIVLTNPARVEFQGTGLQVYDTQVVKITFFVDISTYDVMQTKLVALERIKDICNCATTDCNLKEVLDQGNVIDFTCVYPQPDAPAPPLQQTVIVSAKTVPHRYFDETGVYQKDIDFTTPDQEGTKFEYTSDNLLKPNNVTNHIGFNEIYGSFTTKTSSAKPAVEVSVQKDKSYDIFVDSGNFATCFFCGTDYYSNIVKMFPQNFLSRGAGYSPQTGNTDRFSTSATYRADDLLFGRACWLPATMIPWSHDPDTDRQQQRQKRLAAQHFLFANGYQRDWYGFDYGSIIGSFDGVKWFSIGNQRRIKAQSSKLFLAVNAYFGDQTTESSFSVTVSDASSIPASGSTITSDFNSDGAQCQKLHVCDTDRDCASQLGWEYSCETITSLTSRWPEFDSNGLETPGVEATKSFLQLFGASAGGSKRCVYRGRGAPCVQDYEINDPASSFNGTTKLGNHVCSSNTYCQRFLDGSNQAKFNRKISRYGKSAKVLNATPSTGFVDLDTFGLGVKILGRPNQWIGDQTLLPEPQSALSNNDVNSICIPGKDPDLSATTVKNQNGSTPSNNHLGDQVLNLGVTPVGQLGLDHYLSSCSIFDANGEYYNQVSANLTKTLDNTELARLAGSQAIPTNSLAVLETLSSNTLITDFDNLQITSPVLQENRCLRAPGASCFSNLDCAPSSLIAEKAAKIDASDTTIWTTLNKYEILFWQEDLICSQEKASTDVDFDAGNNRCCREIGKSITIGSLTDQSHHPTADATIPSFDNFNIPGLGSGTNGIDLNDPSRYSRNSTVHDLMSDVTKFPKLQSARKDACSAGGAGCFVEAVEFNFEQQYNTFSNLAERACCTGSWVRNFHPEDNGGGHTWVASKSQDIPKESFKCLNWLQCNNAASTCGTNFTCDHTDEPDDPQCLAKSISNSEASVTVSYLNTLELLGIPQIHVKSSDFTETLCSVDPNDQSLSGITGLDLIPGLQATNVPTNAEYSTGGIANRKYASDDPDNFDSNMKRIFSPDTVTCCLPAGTQMAPGDDANTCCTGFINPGNNKCQLDDFTNVSVFFNRYVSSHAKDIADGLIDKETGYITSPSTVEQLACELKVCASDRIARGVAVSNLKVPGHETSQKGVKRWIDSSGLANQGLDSLYDDGQRWNDDVYCVPPDSNVSTVIDCSQF